MSDTYCALPWNHLTINPYGGAQVCCVSRNFINEDGTDLSLYNHSLEEVFNAKSIRSVRQNMLAGKKSPECQHCYNNEARGLKSERLLNNNLFEAKYDFSIEDAKATTHDDGSTTIKRPSYYQLLVSNVCNLACRMCNSSSSSKIEADPVHNAWAPGPSAHSLPKWEGSKVEIGPSRRMGVTRRGIKMMIQEDIRRFFLEKDAEFCIPRMNATDPFVGCEITLTSSNTGEWGLEVLADGKTVFQLQSTEKIVTQTIMFHDLKESNKDLRIQFKIYGEQEIELRTINVIRHSSGIKKREITISRFSDQTKSLFEQDSFLFKELLGQPETLKRLYVVGGEPFYAKPLLRMIDYLEDTGDCSHIDAIFTTNATIVDDKLLSQLRKFREVHIGFSVEGFGPVQEYIRYPSKWVEIETNIKKFQQIDGIRLHAIATVQYQSVLYLSDLLRFCDSLNIFCGFNLVHEPDFLNILSMPRPARVLAAERLEAYIEADNPVTNTVNEIQPIINHLRSNEDMFNHDILKKFMLFTNDLDQSRNQSFANTFPELFALIKNTGFRWSNETRYITD